MKKTSQEPQASDPLKGASHLHGCVPCTKYGAGKQSWQLENVLQRCFCNQCVLCKDPRQHWTDGKSILDVAAEFIGRAFECGVKEGTWRLGHFVNPQSGGRLNDQPWNRSKVHVEVSLAETRIRFNDATGPKTLVKFDGGDRARGEALQALVEELFGEGSFAGAS
jgi:hypothetical protein